MQKHKNNLKNDILDYFSNNFLFFYEKLNWKPSKTRPPWAMGLCPFHAEKNPSFSVNISSGGFHCFGCQESGDVFKFASKILSIDDQTEFPLLLKTLASILNMEEQDEYK